MSDGAIIAIISGAFTLIGTIITVAVSSRKQTTDINSKIAVIEEKISHLKASVDKHNNFAQRIPVIEERLKVVDHRIDDLEKGA